ncbi:hypothetical protein F5B21DRAFT_499759 [Xylaria acuta]|nr:hypothetical protein F5B21DRAFT_499759 [Xylaria acuta]
MDSYHGAERNTDEMLFERPPHSPCTPPPTSEPQRGDEHCSSSSSEPCSITVMKIYMDKKIYSIYDRINKKYIYHAKRGPNDGLTITYNEDGRCTVIHDNNGNEVYAKRKDDR